MNNNQPPKKAHRLMPAANRDRRFNGIIIAVCSLLAIVNGALAVTVIVSLASGHILSGGLHGSAGALAFFVGVMILFIIIAKNIYRQNTALTEMERDRAVLAFARQTRAPLTIPAVALHCSLRIVDAAAVLNSLTMRGVCQMDIGEDGEMFYRFSTFESQNNIDTVEIEPLT